MADPEFLLDSDICVYVIGDGGGAAARRLARCRRDTVVTSAIVYAEVIRGLGNDPVAQLAATMLFRVAPVQPFDEAAANAYAGLPFRRAKFDQLIGAHALSLGLTLVTANTKDFADIPGLKVEDWTLPQ